MSNNAIKLNNKGEIKRSNRRNFWVASISESIIDFSSYASKTYLPNYIVSIGGTEELVGRISSLGYFIWALVQPSGGYLCDKIGRRSVIIYLTGLLALSYLIYSLAPSWHVILIAMILESISSMYIPALQTLLAESLEEKERTRGFLILNVLSNALSIPAPYLGGLIIEKVGSVKGNRYVFLLASVLIFTMLIMRFFLLKETYGGMKVNVAKTKSLNSVIYHLKGVFKVIKRMSKPLLILLLIESLTFSLPMGLLSPYMIRYASSKGVTEERWGEIISVARLAYFITVIGMMPIMNKLPSTYYLFLGSIMASISMALFPNGYFLQSAILLLIAQAIYGAAILSLFSSMASSDIRGTIMGISSMISMLLGASGSFIASFMYPRNPFMNFISASVLFLIGAIVILPISKLIRDYIS
ncbi:MAG: hypothetical protein DRJ66_05365 [Thermoprotei archaeon]|nr:MAG: hypothetical protein DRJ66_05365 [Thermoprotei archaeon]